MKSVVVSVKKRNVVFTEKTYHCPHKGCEFSSKNQVETTRHYVYSHGIKGSETVGAGKRLLYFDDPEVLSFYNRSAKWEGPGWYLEYEVGEDEDCVDTFVEFASSWFDSEAKELEERKSTLDWVRTKLAMLDNPGGPNEG